MYDLITGACRAAGFTPLPGPTLGSVQDLLASQVAAGRCWTLLYAGTPFTSIPRGVALLRPRLPVHVPTGLAVRPTTTGPYSTSCLRPHGKRPDPPAGPAPAK